MKRLPITTAVDCRAEIERMLKNSQTKVIMPAVAFGVLRHYSMTKQTVLGDGEIKRAYTKRFGYLKSISAMMFTLAQNMKTPTE